MKSGIYEVLHLPSGSRYVGSAANLADRMNSHRRMLRSGRHHSRHLQRAWNKHGEETFEFRRLLVCSKENLVMYEQRAFDVLKPEYNIDPVAGSRLGSSHSLKTRAQISAAKMGRVSKGAGMPKGFKCTPETRAKMSLAQLSRNQSGSKLTEEHKAKISASSRGRQMGHEVSAETRAKISAGNLGNKKRLGSKHTDDAKAKISAARKGKSLSLEHRAKIAASLAVFHRLIVSGGL